MSPGPRRSAGWWAAALLWMALIFAGSLSYLSGTHTAEFLDRIARALHWHLAWGREKEINHLVRKAGHLTEYAVLAGLLHAALRRTFALPRAALAALAFGLAAAYAASDEYHQKFVPGRTSERRDVALDAVGAAVGIALAWRVPRGWRRSEAEEQPPREA